MIFGPFFTAALLAAATMNPVALVAGDKAPDFSYQSHDYLWQNLHNMLEQGSVLLVFGAGEAELRALESERDELLRQGVIPVAVVRRREGDVWKLLRKTNVTYSLLADPNGTIAEQYGLQDASSSVGNASWFVIDPTGRVRETGTGSLSHDWSQVASRALGQGDVRTAGSR